MYKKMLLPLIAVLAICGCNKTENKTYTVQGNLKGLEGTVYLVNGQGAAMDSTRATEGKFQFTGSVETPHEAYLQNGGNTFFLFFLENDDIQIAGDMTQITNIRATGNAANEALFAHTAKRNEMIREFFKPETTDERKEELMQQDSLLTLETIRDNRDNSYGVFLLNTELTAGLTPDQILEEIELFTPEMQRTKTLKSLKAKAEQMKKNDVGQIYINLELPNQLGDTVSLANVIGHNKYVLLDFWASWCPPCMGEMSYLREAMNKYGEKKFAIYAVSLDDNHESWQNAINKNNLFWYQVSDLKGWESTAAALYSVSSIPANFLISHEGRIVAKNLRGKELDKKLAELFK